MELSELETRPISNRLPDASTYLEYWKPHCSNSPPTRESIGDIPLAKTSKQLRLAISDYYDSGNLKWVSSQGEAIPIDNMAYSRMVFVLRTIWDWICCANGYFGLVSEPNKNLGRLSLYPPSYLAHVFNELAEKLAAKEYDFNLVEGSTYISTVVTYSRSFVRVYQDISSSKEIKEKVVNNENYLNLLNLPLAVKGVSKLVSTQLKASETGIRLGNTTLSVANSTFAPREAKDYPKTISDSTKVLLGFEKLGPGLHDSHSLRFWEQDPNVPVKQGGHPSLYAALVDSSPSDFQLGLF